MFLEVESTSAPAGSGDEGYQAGHAPDTEKSGEEKKTEDEKPPADKYPIPGPGELPTEQG